MAQSSSINLLRSSQSHTLDKILQWALSTGRFLIILTQTIALAAFAYRFTLDRQIIDLGDSIKQNQAIVSLYSEEEAKYRNLHERLLFADTIMQQEEGSIVLLQKLVGAAEGKVVFNAVQINGNSAKIEVAARSTGALSVFLNDLRRLNEIKTVSVDRAENKTTTGTILVTVTAELLNGKEEPATDESR